ncbi:cell division protein ZapD [Nitrosomonas sp. HPC101]|uniref:cell division protein ZapD n=1 Tax=Nitrosomonas sp. HPC101 TaxID=1658667 RepID=UPI001F049B1C|nr:cell division protein ZapD [Nitrosomonas sp. HPC101]
MQLLFSAMLCNSTAILFTVICYELPLNERIRMLLRLEDLFDKIDFFSTRDTSFEHHAALVALFEILDVTSRSDLKSDLLQELDKQRTMLEGLQDNPDVSEKALVHILQDIRAAFRGLLDIPGRIGGHLRDDEWLMSVKQRMNIPGGACEFDLPTYHYWLNMAPETRRTDLRNWIIPLASIRNGINIVLNMLRNSGKSFCYLAVQGVFQQAGSEHHGHLLRLHISDEFSCIPEISANKYAINIRFVPWRSDRKTEVYEEDIPFELTFCSL